MSLEWIFIKNRDLLQNASSSANSSASLPAYVRLVAQRRGSAGRAIYCL